MKRALVVLLLVVVALAVFLFSKPTAVEPVAWEAPKPPSLLTGPYASNTRLRPIERVLKGEGHGPESIAVGRDGSLYTGYLDGRIVRFAEEATSARVLSNGGGRPLGMAVHPDGRLIVADAVRGLVALDESVGLSVLAVEAGGVKLGFPDDVVIDRAGAFAYLTDASTKFGWGHDVDDILEHGAHGRLIRYEFATGQATVLLAGLEFANGVALGPDDAFLLVAESGAYRVRRYWLAGPRAGQDEVFLDNLPGFPDNITWNGRDRFWIAMYTPRDRTLDTTSGRPFARKTLARALARVGDRSPHYAMVFAFDPQGKLVANLQYGGADAYGHITSVLESGKWLWFGSLVEDAVGRMPLGLALASH